MKVQHRSPHRFCRHMQVVFLRHPRVRRMPHHPTDQFQRHALKPLVGRECLASELGDETNGFAILMHRLFAQAAFTACDSCPSAWSGHGILGTDAHSSLSQTRPTACLRSSQLRAAASLIQASRFENSLSIGFRSGLHDGENPNPAQTIAGQRVAEWRGIDQGLPARCPSVRLSFHRR